MDVLMPDLDQRSTTPFEQGRQVFQAGPIHCKSRTETTQRSNSHPYPKGLHHSEDVFVGVTTIWDINTGRVVPSA